MLICLKTPSVAGCFGRRTTSEPLSSHSASLFSDADALFRSLAKPNERSALCVSGTATSLLAKSTAASATATGSMAKMRPIGETPLLHKATNSRCLMNWPSVNSIPRSAAIGNICAAMSGRRSPLYRSSATVPSGAERRTLSASSIRSSVSVSADIADNTRAK
jgi:hypothetical protein